MELKAVVDNKTLGITRGKIYNCWTLNMGNYSIFEVDENDNGDNIIASGSIFEQVDVVEL